MPVKPEDAQRYNEICLQYYDAILSFCNARMGFRLEDAKDCTQQVFQLLLESFPIWIRRRTSWRGCIGWPAI